MLKEIKKISKATKMSINEINMVMKNSIEIFFADFFNYNAIPFYNVENKVLSVPLVDRKPFPELEPLDLNIISEFDYIPGETVVLDFPLEKIEKNLFQKLYKEIVYNLANLKIYKKRLYWINILKTKKIVSGKFISKKESRFYVQLPEKTMGILKDESINTLEIDKYLPETTFVFFIKKVCFLKEQQEIYLDLSRTSKNLPVQMFKEEFPEYRFKAVRRLAGEKSFIETNYPFDYKFTPVRDKIAKELNEIIETRAEGYYQD
jgi:hypothetical protein